jgi:hypothetical protein
MATNKTAELKYVEKLNISTLGINGVKNLIKKDIKLSLKAFEANMPFTKNTFHIIGPAGVGKTQIFNQIADELNNELKEKFQVIMIKAPVLSRDDMIIPFPIVDNGKTSFKMLYSDFIPKDPDSAGIFVIDEFSRGDHAFQQLMWQVQNEFSLHMHKFPKKWFVASVDNPDDQEYSMDTLEDAAGLRRMIHIYVEVNPMEFLKYAGLHNFHSLVIGYIEAKPDMLYDFDSQKKGSVFANPASWEKISDHLKKYELEGGWQTSVEEIEHICAGLINVSHTRLFIEFARNMKDVTPRDIFERYPKVRPIVLDFVKSNNNAKLSEIIKGFFTFMMNSKPTYGKKELGHIVNFLTDIPVDTAAVFITDIDSLERNTDEYKYLTKLHATAIGDAKYRKEFYEKLATVSDKKYE